MRIMLFNNKTLKELSMNLLRFKNDCRISQKGGVQYIMLKKKI